MLLTPFQHTMIHVNNNVTWTVLYKHCIGNTSLMLGKKCIRITWLGTSQQRRSSIFCCHNTSRAAFLIWIWVVKGCPFCDRYLQLNLLHCEPGSRLLPCAAWICCVLLLAVVCGFPASQSLPPSLPLSLPPPFVYCCLGLGSCICHSTLAGVPFLPVCALRDGQAPASAAASLMATANT